MSNHHLSVLKHPSWAIPQILSTHHCRWDNPLVNNKYALKLLYHVLGNLLIPTTYKYDVNIYRYTPKNTYIYMLLMLIHHLHMLYIYVLYMHCIYTYVHMYNNVHSMVKKTQKNRTHPFTRAWAVNMAPKENCKVKCRPPPPVAFHGGETAELERVDF